MLPAEIEPTPMPDTWTAIEQQLQDGDILLVAHVDPPLLSKAIQKLTGSPFSHSALYLDHGVYESNTHPEQSPKDGPHRCDDGTWEDRFA